MSPQIDATGGGARTNPIGVAEAPPPAPAPQFGPPSDAFDYQAPVEGATTLFAKGAGDAGPVDINDIKQGHMGDCYLVGAIGSLVKQGPNAIRDMVHENRDAAGNVASYTVDLHQRGRKVPVTVDAKEFSNVAAEFGDTDGAGRHEIWVKVVEKAYAQLQGGYGKIGHGGQAGEVLETLTGIPAKECAPGAYGFDRLQKDLAEKRPVCFSMTAPEGDARATPSQARLKLWGNHCYSVIDCQQRDGKRMVRLSNPWGDDWQAGARKDGWVAYDDLMRDNNVAGVTVGGDKGFHLWDAFKAFWRA